MARQRAQTWRFDFVLRMPDLSSREDVRLICRDILDTALYQQAIRGIKQSSFSYSIPEVVEDKCLATICGYLHTTEQHFQTAVQGWISDERIGEIDGHQFVRAKIPTGGTMTASRTLLMRAMAASDASNTGLLPAANVPVKSGGGGGTRRCRRRPTSASRAPPRPPGRAAGRARTFKRWTPTHPGRRPCAQGSICLHRRCSACCAPN